MMAGGILVPGWYPGLLPGSQSKIKDALHDSVPTDGCWKLIFVTIGMT